MQYLQILLRIMRFSSVFSPGARHLRRFSGCVNISQISCASKCGSSAG